MQWRPIISIQIKELEGKGRRSMRLTGFSCKEDCGLEWLCSAAFGKVCVGERSDRSATTLYSVNASPLEMEMSGSI